VKANKEYEMATNMENTNTIGAGLQTNTAHVWSETDVETRSTPPPPHGNRSDNEDDTNQSATRPSFGQHGAAPVNIDPDAQILAEAFYARYKSACHGITRRIELNRLYDDTFDSWVPHENGASNRPVDFSKVLFAMAHHMRVLRVVDGGRQIVWKVFNKRPQQGREERPERRDHHQGREERPERRDHHQGREERPERRDHHQGREERPERRDHHQGREERPERRDHHQGREERPERRDHHHEHPERRERREYHERRDNHQGREERPERRENHQEHHQERREHQGQRFNLADVVSNQQKMIDALMSKVMKTE
jgi:hypothetical protein